MGCAKCGRQMNVFTAFTCSDCRRIFCDICASGVTGKEGSATVYSFSCPICQEKNAGGKTKKIVGDILAIILSLFALGIFLLLMRTLAKFFHLVD